ncbi:MAG: HEAT repeat domain-containing protein [Verrucomicrobia bacterium]|jgi:HEAT repeat protein|nr:HEAT repeat domain-containing protein [Verrucomicrobiota bacterium]
MKTKNIFLTAVLLCVTSGAFAAASTAAPTPLLTQPADKLVAVLMSNGGRKEKAAACRELAVIGTSKAVPVLAGLLADEELSHMVRYALETIPGASVDRALRDELQRLKGRPLVGVIGSLGVRKDSRAVKPLSSLLSATDTEVAQAAARALGDIGTAKAAQAIEDALPNTAPANRLAFGEGLFRCAETLAGNGKTKDAIALYDRLRGLTDVPDQVRAGALRGAILVRGKGGLGLLKETLASSDRVLFNAAVRAALEMSGPEVTQVLATCLPQLQPENQIVVMQALGARGDAEAVPALSSQAKSGAKNTRVAAIRALAAIGHSSVVPVLVELIEDSESEVAQAALDGLAGIPGREADAVVFNMLKSTSANRRIIGIDLVGRRRMVAAVPALLNAAADSDAKVRSSAVQRLGKLATPTETPALIELLLRSTDEQDLDGLAVALSSICTGAGPPVSATEQIIAALPGAQLAQKGALLTVLGAVGGEKAIASVRAALNDPQAEVREAAVRALADWPDAAAAPDLLQLARSATSGNGRDVAFCGYVRLARESESNTTVKLKMLTEAATLATSTPEKKLVLAGLGDILTVESLRLVTPHLSDAAVADEAGAVAVNIAEKLGTKDAADIGVALNQVLKSAKLPQVLNPARKRMNELKLKVQ